jgi:RND family efflux transporter MFP subunit
MKNKKRLYWIGGIVIPLLAVVIFFPSSSTDIPTAQVKKGDFHILVIESGSIRAKNSFTVTAPRIFSGGNLQVVFLAPEGTVAQPEDVLVRFDPTNALKRINDKQTELKTTLADLDKLKAQQAADESQAKTDLETADLNFKLAELALKRMEFEPEAKKREAALEFERSKLAYEQAQMNSKNKGIVRKSELGNLNLKIAQIRGDIAASMKEMEQLTIKAPISGLIVFENNWSTGRKIAVGDQPWPGMPIISLPDLSAAQVEVSINEMDIAKVKTGQKVDIIPDAFPDRSFSGTISSVSQIGHEKGSGSSIKVFDIVVDIDKTDEILKPGITTTNKIVVGTLKDVVYIPIVSVFEENKKTFVYVRSGGSFNKREVELGERNDNYVVVKNGLTEQDQVALRNPEAREDKEGGQKKDQPKVAKEAKP